MPLVPAGFRPAAADFGQRRRLGQGHAAGQFGHIDFADYVTENTHLIGMGFSSSQALADRYAESLVEDQNCPRAVGITSLAEIPAAIGQYIETVL